jgi:hypothetical protein
MPLFFATERKWRCAAYHQVGDYIEPATGAATDLNQSILSPKSRTSSHRLSIFSTVDDCIGSISTTEIRKCGPSFKNGRCGIILEFQSYWVMRVLGLKVKQFQHAQKQGKGKKLPKHRLSSPARAHLITRQFSNSLAISRFNASWIAAAQSSSSQPQGLSVLKLKPLDAKETVSDFKIHGGHLLVELG